MAVEFAAIKGKVPKHVADWMEAEADARMIGTDRILTDALTAFVAIIPGGPEVPMGTAATNAAPASAPAPKAEPAKKVQEPVKAGN
jgi:hypothetical protein